jgi:hypothetical protein
MFNLENLLMKKFNNKFIIHLFNDIILCYF